MLSREEVVAKIQQLPEDQQAAALELALKIYGPANAGRVDAKLFAQFAPTQFDAAAYIRKYLGWEPWSGTEDAPGQLQVIEAYNLALRQQFEKRDFENGTLTEEQLTVWTPGQVIQNRIRVPAGHTVGKTKLSSGLVSHFFDSFPPAIVMTFAPTADQIKYLLWKEIGEDRGAAITRGEKLPGRILDSCEIKYKSNHFAIGRATNDNGGNGTERVQGQHGPFLLFVLDEAEGIPEFVYNAVDSMASGGIVIVLLLANPRTDTSHFALQADRPDTITLRISCTGHPNVLQNREVVPGAVQRGYVASMAAKHCEVVSDHAPDLDTFSLPFELQLVDRTLPPGTILKPNSEFLFRVLGKAPSNLAGNNFVTRGRYEAAKNRFQEEVVGRDPDVIRMGLDVARWGIDFGTLYVWHDGQIWREAQLFQKDSLKYFKTVKDTALRLHSEAPPGRRPRHLSIRVDGTGGWGSGVIDQLRADEELRLAFASFEVYEVNFGGVAHDKSKYSNLITQLYAEAAETLLGVSLQHPPNALEGDLCKRTFEFINREGKTLQAITEKEKFRKAFKRSPDDGDGFVLCASPEHVFAHLKPREPQRGAALPASSLGRPGPVDRFGRPQKNRR